ncbi:MAG: HDOD domain-containing protein [Pirellulales bacterium]|nr:HDOD domain-containing protein [Pirellulales bacterium]
MASIDSDLLPEIDGLLDRLEKLHSSPAVAIKLMELIRNPDFEIADVSRCLEHDPALAASILRLVNSSYYGAAQEITSIRHALAYLGRRTIRMAILGFGLIKALVQGSPAIFHRSYWRRTLTMATAARQCALRIDPHETCPDTAFTAGLLADLGMAVLVQLETAKYLPLCIQGDHIIQQPELEIEAFGFHHIDVSQRLLTRWELPNDLVQAIATHHRCPPNAPRMNHILLASNLLAEVLWIPDSPYIKSLLQILHCHLDLDEDDLIALAVECKKSVNESFQIFQVRINGKIDIDAIQESARKLRDKIALEDAADLDSLEAFMNDSTRIKTASETGDIQS